MPAIALFVLLCQACPSSGAETNTEVIQRIALVPLTHLDLGYTDHPAVAREYQRRYVGIGIDAVLPAGHPL